MLIKDSEEQVFNLMKYYKGQALKLNIINCFPLKAISRILFVFLGASSMVGVFLLSGCALPGGEKYYLYRISIDNKLNIPIFVCYDHNPSSCIDKVGGGQRVTEIYYSHSDEDDEKRESERMGGFDGQSIGGCGRYIEFTAVRSVSPVVKIDSKSYQIVINDLVYDRVCQSVNY